MSLGGRPIVVTITVDVLRLLVVSLALQALHQE